MRISGVCLFCIYLLVSLAAHGQNSEYANSIGMQFVLVQQGTMQVGVFHPTCSNQPMRFGRGPAAPAGAAPYPSGQSAVAPPPPDPRVLWDEAEKQKCLDLVKQDSSDGFTVRIERPYYIGKTEVTQDQWKKVMGSNPSVFQGDKIYDDWKNHPVDNVTWQDVQAFVKRLNALEKTNLYHLPTEFQWEYACRAGGPGQQSWDAIRQQAVQGVGGGFGAAATGAVALHPTTLSVGSKEPNAWGIYDMLGNVWEWVQDPYNDKLFADQNPAHLGKEHVLKGGGFDSDVKNTICATHGAGPADGWDVGFRVVRDLH